MWKDVQGCTHVQASDWGPQCLTVLDVAPITDKGLRSVRLYKNMTNCSPTCETRKYHIHMIEDSVRKVVHGCTHVQAADGVRSACQYLMLRLKLTRGWDRWDSTKTWQTDLLHVNLGNIIIKWTRNACEKLYMVVPMFRLPMGSAVPDSTWCCAKPDKGLRSVRLYKNMTNCSPTCETR